jgi:hypothetical protein
LDYKFQKICLHLMSKFVCFLLFKQINYFVFSEIFNLIVFIFLLVFFNLPVLKCTFSLFFIRFNISFSYPQLNWRYCFFHQDFLSLVFLFWLLFLSLIFSNLQKKEVYLTKINFDLKKEHSTIESLGFYFLLSTH